MPTSISFLNMKGGVGKTTLAVNVAAGLAKLWGKKVLLVDLDPQYNATQYLVNLADRPNLVDGSQPTVFSIFMAGKRVSLPDGGSNTFPEYSLEEVATNVFSSNAGEGKLDLIPGSLQLINLHESQRGTEGKLAAFLVEKASPYDYILIDCPPTFSFYILAALAASDTYIIPIKPDPLSMLGLPLLQASTEQYRTNTGRKVNPLGIVFTMVRGTSLMNQVREGVKAEFAGQVYVFENVLSMSTYIAETTHKRVSLFDYPKASRYADEMKAIIDEIRTLLGDTS